MTPIFISSPSVTLFSPLVAYTPCHRFNRPHPTPTATDVHLYLSLSCAQHCRTASLKHLFFLTGLFLSCISTVTSPPLRQQHVDKSSNTPPYHLLWGVPESPSLQIRHLSSQTDLCYSHKPLHLVHKSHS